MATLQPKYYSSSSNGTGYFSSISGYSSTSISTAITFYYDVSGYDFQSFQIEIPVRYYNNSSEAISMYTEVAPMVCTSNGSNYAARLNDYSPRQSFDQNVQSGENHVTISASFSGSHAFTSKQLLAISVVGGNLGTTVYKYIESPPTITIGSSSDPGSGSGTGTTTSYSAQVSIVTPYGGTKEYGSTVNFGFDVQTNGTLTEWRAQYSTNDGYSWSSLPVSNVTTNSDNGPIEVRFTSGTAFPVGTIRWRVQVRVNGQSYDSTWTSASFTVAENTGSGSGSSDDVIVPVEYDNGEIVVGVIDDNGSDNNTIYAVSCSIVQPSNGSKRSGSADIPFKFSVRSSGWPTEYQAEYSTDEGLTWNALAQDYIDSGQNEITFPVPRMTLPSGPIEWRVRARANGDWQYDWTSTSFTVTYDGYGSIQATSGPINSGILGTSSIRYDATMQIIGETIGQPTLIEAKFRWRSGDSFDYIERSMMIDNNSAYIIIPVDTFPYGLIQWYMYGKDSSGIESETPVYSTYILKSVIDSFPIKPVSSIEQSENAIEFKWGYISLNGQKLKKYEFQFSEDGVTWGTSVSYDTVEDLEEEVPLIPPSGEDVFEEEVGE